MTNRLNVVCKCNGKAVSLKGGSSDMCSNPMDPEASCSVEKGSHRRTVLSHPLT